MKLNEIFDTKTRERETPNIGRYNGSDAEQSSGGAYGYVVPDKHDSHMVRKRPHGSTNNNDAYYNYIKYIVDNKIAQHNPYAPRVYKINKFKSSDGRIRYDIQMEKLIDFKKIDKEELITFIKDFVPSDKIPNDLEEYDSYSTAIVLAGYIEKMYRNNTPIDENMAEIFSIITKLRRELSAALDLYNTGNTLFRRTPTGLQLVITDPLS